MTHVISDYPKAGSILALIGGILVVFGGVLLMGVSAFVLPHINFSNVTTPSGLTPNVIPGLVSGIVGVIGGFGLVCGAIVLISAILLLTNSGQPRTWGVLILVFSVMSFLGLGGFVVGAILGIIGGIMTLRWKPPTQ
jgi:uncharacterized membrane protein